MAVYPDDPRTGDIISNGEAGDVVLLGFPYDEGVRRNGGRIGAAGGPESLRKYFILSPHLSSKFHLSSFMLSKIIN